MARFLHKYQTQADFTAAYNGSAYHEPWVSVTNGDASGRVDYNKVVEPDPYLDIPLTFDILSSGVIKWSDKSNGAYSYNVIEYSKNGGSWTSITATSAGVLINVVSGDTVQFRGNNQSYMITYQTIDGEIMASCCF